MIDPAVLVALVAAVPASIAAWAALQGKKQLKPTNGSTVAKTIEKVATDLAVLGQKVEGLADQVVVLTDRVWERVRDETGG